ncbi:LysR family transcriptional regulator [Cupriavidus basilensis]
MKPEPTEPSAESAKAFAPLKISSRQIALINALAEHRNLRRAAAAMHTTQPAASLLLQQLEERLGVQLFERLPRGMEPTLYGEVLIRFAQGVTHEFGHAEAEIAELGRGAVGPGADRHRHGSGADDPDARAAGVQGRSPEGADCH